MKVSECIEKLLHDDLEPERSELIASLRREINPDDIESVNKLMKALEPNGAEALMVKILEERESSSPDFFAKLKEARRRGGNAYQNYLKADPERYRAIEKLSKENEHARRATELLASMKRALLLYQEIAGEMEVVGSFFLFGHGFALFLTKGALLQVSASTVTSHDLKEFDRIDVVRNDMGANEVTVNSHKPPGGREPMFRWTLVAGEWSAKDSLTLKRLAAVLVAATSR